MQHHPITTGDLAMSMAQNEAHARKSLEQRVAHLEQEIVRISEWSEEMAKTLNETFEAIANYLGIELEDDK